MKKYSHLLSRQKKHLLSHLCIKGVPSSIYIIYVLGSGSTFGGLGTGAPPPPPPYGGQSGASGFGGQSGTPIFGGQPKTTGFGGQSSSSGQPSSVFGEKKSSTGERKTVFESVASTTTPTELFKR